MTLSETTILSKSGTGNNVNEGVFHIPQSYRAETSSSDCLVSYLEHSLASILSLCRDLVRCREEENLVFWFGAQFNSTLNFTQSG